MSVVFNEAAHTYTNPMGERYISVTTLVNKYKPAFDAHYWSTYKAMKAVLTKKGTWHEYKQKCGGWENVVQYVRVIDTAFPHREEVFEEKKRLLKEWDDTKDAASERGTFFHKTKEAATKGEKLFAPDMREISLLSGDPLAMQNFEDSGVYTELLLYNHDFKIAGQADWVMKLGKHVTIRDYKTSKTIEKKAFMDETLYHPLTHLPNANFYSYSIQLSLYGYLLEQAGYIVDRLEIEHIDRASLRTIEIHPVNYYRQEVKELIEHYRVQNKTKLHSA